MRIAIIGGGASGLIAAAAAKNDENEVYVLEREKRVGKKILATGNGRCNMTNMYADPSRYHGRDRDFIKGAMTRFWVDETLDFFSELGILWKEEENGKVYPYSDSASAVLDVLRRHIDGLGVNTICGFDVKSIKRNGGGFKITSYDDKTIHVDRVIIATGGKASPSLGSNGSGYDLLRSFSHTITELSPSLVQIKTNPETVRKLKGIKVNGNLKIGNNSECGEILFTDYGLSGPPVFSISAYLGDGSGSGDTAQLDIMPEYSYDEVYNMLCMRCGYLYDLPLEEFFTGMLNKRVGQAILKDNGIAPLSRKVSSVTDKELKRIASVIKDWHFTICGTMSWNNAQVTHGGAVTKEFNPTTMQSLLAEGVYACGEVLDIDGDCGGFNLQWAWSSGYIAGKNAAK